MKLVRSKRLKRYKRKKQIQSISNTTFDEGLPLELKHEIMERLSTKTLLAMRLVSRSWKILVDGYAKFDAEIDDKSPGFSGLCTFRMKKCKVGSFSSPSFHKFFNAAMPDSVIIEKKMSSWLMRILNRNWNHLQKLEICWRSMSNCFLFKNCPSLNRVKKPSSRCRGISQFLPNLKCLRLGLQTIEPMDTNNLVQVTLLNLKYLLHNEYERLTHIKINYIYPRLVQEYYNYLHPFLQKHTSNYSLVKIDFDLSYVLADDVPISPRNVIFDKAEWPDSALRLKSAKMTTLNKLRFKKDNASTVDKWSSFISNHSMLEFLVHEVFLSVFVRNLNDYAGHIKYCSPFLRVAEAACLATYTIDPPFFSSPLDLTTFSDCQQLKSMKLWRAPILVNNPQNQLAYEIKNLMALPKSLRNLMIDGMPIRSTDLRDGLNEMKELTTLCYYKGSLPPRNLQERIGVDKKTFNTIMSHPSLKLAIVNIESDISLDTLCGPKYRKFATSYHWKIMTIFRSYSDLLRVELQKCDAKYQNF